MRSSTPRLKPQGFQVEGPDGKDYWFSLNWCAPEPEVGIASPWAEVSAVYDSTGKDVSSDMDQQWILDTCDNLVSSHHPMLCDPPGSDL